MSDTERDKVREKGKRMGINEMIKRNEKTDNIK